MKTLTAQFILRDGRVTLNRTTDKFPVEDFSTCIKLLTNDLDKEKLRIHKDEMERNGNNCPTKGPDSDKLRPIP